MSDSSESDNESMSSLSDDDIQRIYGVPRVKNNDYLEETVVNYDDRTFFEHFRVSRATYQEIAQKFEVSPYYKEDSGQYGNVSANDQVLITLWFLGHQTCSYRDVGDRFNVTVSSISRILRRVIFTISNLAPQIIRWPTNEEKVMSEQHFRENGFPGAIGAIDACHIKIDKPINDSDSYINRKGYYSIQMQAICDDRRKIIDVFVGYPGSVHDSRVFRNSSIYENLEEKCGGYFLLGDSGYPLKRNILTPFKDQGQLTNRQVNYNIKLSKNRYVIEHCFGILKQKFRQLYHLKVRDTVFAVHLIRAACVLHNVAINDDFEIPEDIQEEIVNNPQHINDNRLEIVEEEEDNRDAQEIRNTIVQSLPM